MKLFKKLAAAALAAVLALSMVGCGVGGTGSALNLKNEVLNAIEDSYNLSGKAATRTTAMDTEAAALIEKAATAGAAEGNNDTVKELLQKKGTGDYIAIFAPYAQLRTELMQQEYVQMMKWELDKAIHNITNDNVYNDDDMLVKIGSPVIGKADSIEMGAATGTIKGKNYLVLLVKKAEA